ncbi:MAG: hypothetical protein ACREF7_01995 [Candidatus Saccharimonadales bacterium]
MYHLTTNPILHRISLWAAEVMPVVIILFLSVSVAYGSTELGERSIDIANDTPGISTSYNIILNTTGSEMLGSIEVVFCSNSPLVTDSCSVPNGFDISGATISSQTGPGDFTVSNLTNSNTLVLTRTPSIVSAGELSFNLAGITNPTTIGTFYARELTFPSSDASGSPTDTGGVALAINSSVLVTTYVPPYLYFCAGISISGFDCNNTGGNYLNFGNLTPAATSSSESQMLIATNAKNGYTIQANGNSMTSGNNVILPLSTASLAKPGTNQFGLNLVANSQPSIGGNVQGPGTGSPVLSYSQPNIFKYTNGDVVASSSVASDLREYTVSYIIDINSSQPPGYYATTLTYIGMGNF